MLSQVNYTSEHIAAIREQTKADPSIIERTVFAFGLLEAITRVGLPFIFKGGTSLLVMLDDPRRLSTDIDIIVEPGTNIDEYIEQAGRIFPFVRCCICILGRGSIREEEYKLFSDGIGAIQNHIFKGRINGETAGAYACEVMYLAASLLTGAKDYVKIVDPEPFRNSEMKMQGIKKVSSLRNANPLAYAYMAKSLQMLQEIGIFTKSVLE